MSSRDYCNISINSFVYQVYILYWDILQGCYMLWNLIVFAVFTGAVD